jgi:hypothetical protein
LGRDECRVAERRTRGYPFILAGLEPHGEKYAFILAGLEPHGEEDVVARLPVPLSTASRWGQDKRWISAVKSGATGTALVHAELAAVASASVA